MSKNIGSQRRKHVPTNRLPVNWVDKDVSVGMIYLWHVFKFLKTARWTSYKRGTGMCPIACNESVFEVRCMVKILVCKGLRSPNPYCEKGQDEKIAVYYDFLQCNKQWHATARIEGQMYVDSKRDGTKNDWSQTAAVFSEHKRTLWRENITVKLAANEMKLTTSQVLDIHSKVMRTRIQWKSSTKPVDLR